MQQISIIDILDTTHWDSIVRSFKQYDVYYLSGYAKGFQLHGDGEPILVHYNSSELRGICVYIKRQISQIELISGLSDDKRYYDLITPYGYGGFIFEGTITDTSLGNFSKVHSSFMFENNIICEFVRFHPILKNIAYAKSGYETIDLGKTIHMDLDNEELIWNNITSKNRNTIRGAMKKGVIVEYSSNPILFDNFIQIYNSTMDKDNASAYYYFSPEYYRSISECLKDNYKIFYATYNGIIIAMSIIIFANDGIHYHLSGSIMEYRNLNPTNLLLYKVACWGHQNGYKTFHLGGGIGCHEDNLYKFKAAFNRTSNNTFSIGKQIFNQKLYNKLVEERAASNESFDKNSSFFPLYRA